MAARMVTSMASSTAMRQGSRGMASLPSQLKVTLEGEPDREHQHSAHDEAEPLHPELQVEIEEAGGGDQSQEQDAGPERPTLQPPHRTSNGGGPERDQRQVRDHLPGWVGPAAREPDHQQRAPGENHAGRRTLAERRSPAATQRRREQHHRRQRRWNEPGPLLASAAQREPALAEGANGEGADVRRQEEEARGGPGGGSKEPVGAGARREAQ